VYSDTDQSSSELVRSGVNHHQLLIPFHIPHAMPFTTLPPELLTAISAFLPTFADVLSLARSCRHLYNVYLSSAPHICRSLLLKPSAAYIVYRGPAGLGTFSSLHHAELLLRRVADDDDPAMQAKALRRRARAVERAIYDLTLDLEERCPGRCWSGFMDPWLFRLVQIRIQCEDRTEKGWGDYWIELARFAWRMRVDAMREAHEMCLRR
jgi:hypothetical protein